MLNSKQEEVNALLITVNNNMAMCQLKLELYGRALASCDKVLSLVWLVD